jgi:hypothetical protein
MVKQSGWFGFPSGDEKIAMEILLPKSEIERRYQLQFIQGEDSLGKGFSSYFVDDLIGPVSLIYCEAQPPERAFVFVDSAVDLSVAVPRIISVLELDASVANVPDYLIKTI